MKLKNISDGLSRNILFFQLVMVFLLSLNLSQLSHGEANAAEPVADAGQYNPIIKDKPIAGTMELNGSGSYDDDGDVLNYHWYGPFATTSGASPYVAIPEGTYTVSLAVDDGSSRAEVDIATITVNPFFNIAARCKPGEIQLTWTHIAGTERYDIYRATESDPLNFVKIAETTSTYSTYLDKPVTNEITYLYAISALSQNTWRYSGVTSSHPTALRVIANYAPEIYSDPVTAATAEIIYNYDVNAADPNGNTLTYSLISPPVGMNINSTTGLITWTPPAAGSYNVAVEVSDGKGGNRSQNFVVNVSEIPALNINHLPHITSSPVVTIIEGQAYAYDVEAIDEDDDSLTFTLTVAHSGMTIDPGTGFLSWTPSNADIGSHDVEVKVDDGRGGEATQAFTIQVTGVTPPANNPPVITSAPVTTATVGAGYSYDIESTDPDADDVLTCSLVTAPSGMTINPATGLIAWTPTLVQVGNHDVTVRVTDQGGLFAEQGFVVAVTAAPANHTPVITSTPTLAAAVGQTYRYQVVATDPDDGDALTYSLPVAPVGMSIDPPGGLVQFTPTADQVGTHSVTVQATDRGGLSTKQSYVVIVSDTPIGNRAPVAVPGLLGEPGLPACVAPPGGMTSWFMGDSSFDDIVGISSPAIIIGSPQLVMGKVGQGIKFDGLSGLIVPNNPTIKFDADDSFTIDAWLRLDGVTFNSCASIVDVRSGTNYGYGIFAYVYPFAPEGMVKFGAGIIAGTGVYAWARPVPMGEYHHVAAVVDRVKRTLAIYLDGLLEQELSIANVGFADARMYIGYPNRDVPTNQGSFNGMIDELEIFNRAISQAEIQSLYLAGSAGKCKLKNGDTVTLDGTGSSDADGDPLTYKWLLLAKPDGSAAALSDQAAAQPTFVADLAGVYRVQLVVNDGQADSSPAEITLQLSDGNLPPIALNDDYSVRLGDTLDLPAPGVIGNDYEPDGTPLSAVQAAGPSHGTLNFSADGAFSYSPDTDVFGPGAKAHTKIGTAYMQGQPKNIAINAWTNRIYVTDLLTDGLEVIDGTSGKVINVLPAIGSYIEDVACNPATNRIYVTGARINQYIEVPMVIFNGVHVFDGTTHALLAMIPIDGFQVEDVAVNPATDRIYVASLDSDSVAVINGQTNAVIANIPVGTDPRQLAVDIQSNRIFALSTVDGTVTQIDGATNDVLATLAVGADPRFLLVDEELGRLFVTSFADASVAVIDQATHTVINNIPVGNGPRGMTLDPITGSLFVANSGDGSVTVIDRDTLAVVRTIAVGAGPESLAVNPLNNTLYVANTAADTLSVVDAATGAVSATVPVGHNPATVAVNPVTDRVYTVDTGSHTVSVVHVGDHFTYKANDGEVDSNIATVTIGIEPQNPAPVALDDYYQYYQVAMGETFTIPAPGLLGNDVTLGGGTLAAKLVSGPASGSLTLNPDGSFAYTPSAGFSGAVTFTYKANDGDLDSHVAHVTIAVEAIANTPPIVTMTAPDSALVNDPVTFTATGTDPDQDPMTYTWQFGDGATATGETVTHAYAAPGNFTVSVTIEDTRGGTATATSAIEIIEPPSENVAPIAEAGGPYEVNINEPLVFDGSSSYDMNQTPLTYEWNFGDGTSGTDVNPSHTYASPGFIEVTLTVTDTEGLQGTDTTQVRIIDPNDTVAPVAILDNEDCVQVYDLYIITGTVSDAGGVSFTLQSREKGTEDWSTFAQGSGTSINGSLGIFDPTLSRNGVYEIRLVAQDSTGNVSIATGCFLLEGNLKVGQVTIPAVDINIPQPGFPLVLEREYDIRDPDPGDFGPGWNLPASTVKAVPTQPLGEQWEQSEQTGQLGLITYILIEKQQHYVVIRFSDSDVVKFKMDVNPKSSFVIPIADGHTELNISYIPAVGTQGTLAALNFGTTVILYGDKLYDWDFNLYNPTRFRYTRPDGSSYIIGTDGIESMTDVYGHTITYAENGIYHSSGASLSFERGEGNRIERITDSIGRAFVYHYDENGMLEKVIQEGSEPEFLRIAAAYANGIIKAETGISVFERPALKSINAPDGTELGQFEYDSSGRMAALIDADGNRIVYGYDVPNHTQEIADPLGNITIYNYDNKGNVTQKVDQLGNVTQWTYDANGNMLAEADPLGYTTSYTYDANKNILTNTDPLGNTTRYTYNSRNKILTETDPKGNVITNTYDSYGNLLTTTDPLGNTTIHTYDSDGNMLSTTDSLGNKTNNTYDNRGNLLSSTDAAGSKTTYTYDAAGNQTSVKDPLGNTTTHAYNIKGQAISTTDALGNTTQTEYNAIGKQSARIDAIGNRTGFVYENRGNLIQTIHPDGAVASSAYDAAGRRTSSTDPMGNTTTYEYDALGRIVRTISPDGSATRTEYDAAGRTVAQIDARGNRTELEYDAAGRQILTRDALGNETTTEYDEAGRVLYQTNALGNTTEYVYDNAGRTVKIIFADGTTTQRTYDAMGRSIAETDQLGNTTQFQYDALGRLTAVIDALGQRTEYAYDQQGNMIIQRDASGRETLFEYDILNRRTATVLPLGQRSLTAYDPAGNVIATTDFNGDTITFAYDSRNRLLYKNLPDGSSINFTYTLAGQRQTVTDSRGVTTFAYDASNRLLSRTDPDGTVISYTYDEAGNRTSVTAPGGTIYYTFNAFNRPATVTDPDGGITRYTYDNAGRLVRTDLPNGTFESRGYDTVNRLVNLENSSSAGIISSYQYTLDAKGNRIAVSEDTGRLVEYVYDALGRLASETITDSVNGNRVISYGFDAVGNRLNRHDSEEGTTTYEYDANDRLLTETLDGQTTTYTYDNNGNTLSRAASPTDSADYTWNAENRLVGADVTDSADEKQIDYQYDADGIRVASIVNGDETRYLIDATHPYQQVLEEYSPGNVIRVSYVHGNDLISQKRGVDRSFYHVDGLGSARALSDADGQITDSYLYDAYGRIVSQSGDTVNSYLFAGEQRDFNVGLDYLRARYMNYEAGRFFATDPLAGSTSAPMSLQKYLYAHANPVNYIDPSGNLALYIDLVASTYLRAILLHPRQANYGLRYSDRYNLVSPFLSGFSNNQDTGFLTLGKEFMIKADLGVAWNPLCGAGANTSNFSIKENWSGRKGTLTFIGLSIDAMSALGTIAGVCVPPSVTISTDWEPFNTTVPFLLEYFKGWGQIWSYGDSAGGGWSFSDLYFNCGYLPDQRKYGFGKNLGWSFDSSMSFGYWSVKVDP